MADYSAQIAALKDAIAQGARRVQFRSGGTQREIEYHSINDMLKALAWLESQQSTKSRLRLAAF